MPSLTPGSCKSANELTLVAVIRSARGTISEDWFGKPTIAELKWMVTLTQYSLNLSIYYPASVTNLGHESGEFVEGLWESDVAEVFLLNRQDGAYLEVNMAPSGAWWAQWFSKYRERDDSQDLPCLDKISSVVTKDAWRADIHLANITRPDRLSDFHVTAILDGKFLSSKPIASIEPDFHEPRCFRSLTPR